MLSQRSVDIQTGGLSKSVYLEYLRKLEIVQLLLQALLILHLDDPCDATSSIGLVNFIQ